MAVEMAAVSMEKPSGALPRSGRVPEQRLLSPRSWLRDGGGSGREKRALRLKSPGKFLPEGEIDAIVTVIELDIISITIIIISIIITAVSTAAHRHRCNNLVRLVLEDMGEV
ncbi:hypothetical protein QYE76_006574 [Lolium multiflorum]|uniref:Uncharacterized protein n=1 Tax=Lolium multiflorum TaxID=4521 RepID=A0AAD8RW34_LOLMU|nr:hypothetical protein QYE76_006574 [Lolium multiflorum]